MLEGEGGTNVSSDDGNSTLGVDSVFIADLQPAVVLLDSDGTSCAPDLRNGSVTKGEPRIAALPRELPVLCLKWPWRFRFGGPI